jgi:L-ornithine N5-oxygenase
LTATGSYKSVLDIVGIGFGPSNLALAIAVEEANLASALAGPVTAQFFERRPEFGWHQGMLIDGASMQISFLKDLVTLRNPTSQFSFLAYLRAKGRLIDFVNHKCLFPSRVEFHDYLSWAASRVAGQVRYDSEVIAARPVLEDGQVSCFEVTVRLGGPTGKVLSCRAHNLVVGIGLAPDLPPGVVLSDRVWHNSQLLPRLGALSRPDPRRFIIVGAGQSAAEVAEYLHRAFPEAEVCPLFSRYGYSPADDTPFANRIFDPEAVDLYYRAPEPVKRSMLAYHSNTNYSVVDIELIEELYRRSYQESVAGVHRLRLFNVSRLSAVQPLPDGVRATIEHLPTGELTVLDADALIYATGYRPLDPRVALAGLDGLLVCDEQGRLRAGRDYRVATSIDTPGGVYLQGGTEHSHGITSSLLSNCAIRAGDILESIGRRLRAASSPVSYAMSNDHV